MEIKNIKIKTFDEIENLLEDKLYSFAKLLQNEGSFLGYDLKILNTKEEIESILPIKMYYDNEIKELGLLNTERFYRLSNGKDILICQAVKKLN